MSGTSPARLDRRAIKNACHAVINAKRRQDEESPSKAQAARQDMLEACNTLEALVPGLEYTGTDDKLARSILALMVAT